LRIGVNIEVFTAVGQVLLAGIKGLAFQADQPSSHQVRLRKTNKDRRSRSVKITTYHRFGLASELDLSFFFLGIHGVSLWLRR
jgi:hypothetical protein